MLKSYSLKTFKGVGIFPKSDFNKQFELNFLQNSKYF